MKRRTPKSLKPLSPQQAVDEIETGDRTRMLLPLREFTQWAKLTEKQALRELQSGRLKTVGVPDGDGLVVFITVADALEWMVNRQMAN